MKIIRETSIEPIKGLIVKRKLAESGANYFSVEVVDKPLEVLLKLISNGLAMKVQHEALGLAKMPAKRMKVVR